MSKKLVPAALLLVVALAAGFGQSLRQADAEVEGLVVTPSETTSGGVVAVVVTLAPNTTEATQIQVTGSSAPMSSSLSASLVVVQCDPGCPGDVGKVGSSVSVEEDNVDTITLGLSLTCNVVWTVTVRADPGEVDEQSQTVRCLPPTGQGVNQDRNIELYGLHQIVLSADPNILPCEGGTTKLTAEAIDTFGNTIDDLEFRFYAIPAAIGPGAGTGGTIVQTSHNTANLTLGPNQFFVKVTASLADDVDVEVDLPTVYVSKACNDAATLVVTASPNVIDCTGTTTITASVRDRNGHVVPGRGFHFVTSAGLLTVNPNNADNTVGTATLTLRPGDGDATVVVTSGFLTGTHEELDDVEGHFVDEETGMVTVRQNCLGTTTGQIKVNSSAKNVGCGEKVFIGLSVVDEDIQTVVDNTPLTLIATHGGFYGGVGDGGATNVLPAAQVPTSHGEANAIYIAPTNYNGEVKITAASGDVYGYEKLNVYGCTAVTPPASGTGATTAPSGPAPCVPIGDGVCITPPNTGRGAITPPSTGSAGLKAR